MTTLNASLPDKRFVAFRLKSNAGCECDYNGLWRLLPSLTYECRPPTDWKLCAGDRVGQYSIRVNDQ